MLRGIPAEVPFFFIGLSCAMRASQQMFLRDIDICRPLQVEIQVFLVQKLGLAQREIMWCHIATWLGALLCDSTALGRATL